MFRLLTDENFDHDILRGLCIRFSGEIDLLVSRAVGLPGVGDPQLRAWATSDERILLTHDRNTIPKHAYQRVINAEPMPGVFVVPQALPVGKAIEELIMIMQCSEQSEWQNVVQYIPV